MSTILLVEDDSLLLDTISELLQLMGHEVLAANTGGKALACLAECKEQVDLVLLDLSLPDMNGRDLLPELTAEYPNLPVVVCSGSLPDELDFKNQPSVKGILNKPFDLSDLREIVDKVINDE